jgi:hypothetical protein
MRLGEEKTAVKEGKVCRDEDMLGGQSPGFSRHDAVVARVLDLARSRLLKKVAPVTGKGPGDRQQVLSRVELRLSVYTDGPRDRERKIGVGRELSLYTGASGRGDLVSDCFDLIGRFRVNEVTCALEVAIDAQFVGDLDDTFDRRRVRSGVGSRPVLAERFQEPPINEPVSDRKLRRCISRHTADNPFRFHERNRFARLL